MAPVAGKPKKDIAGQRIKRAERKAAALAKNPPSVGKGRNRDARAGAGLPKGRSGQKGEQESEPNPYLKTARFLRLKKRFAQHFLIREPILQAIVDCLELQPGETVLEIGPGSGFLTDKLLEKTDQVIGVEVENRMVDYLRGRLGPNPAFTLHQQDILKFDFAQVPAERFKVIGNLPYQISSKILFTLVGELDQPDYALRSRVDRITVMVQKEVGERITAQPGSKAYNPLSIAAQFWYEPKYEFTVSAKEFFPPPKVESAVVSLTPRDKPLVDVNDYALLSRLVRTAFHQKRKTLRNALKGFQVNGLTLDDPTQATLFEANGIDAGLRAEALSIAQFGALANAFGAHTG